MLKHLCKGEYVDGGLSSKKAVDWIPVVMSLSMSYIFLSKQLEFSCEKLCEGLCIFDHKTHTRFLSFSHLFVRLFCVV